MLTLVLSSDFATILLGFYNGNVAADDAVSNIFLFPFPVVTCDTMINLTGSQVQKRRRQGIVFGPGFVDFMH